MTVKKLSWDKGSSYKQKYSLPIDHGDMGVVSGGKLD